MWINYLMSKWCCNNLAKPILYKTLLRLFPALSYFVMQLLTKERCAFLHAQDLQKHVENEKGVSRKENQNVSPKNALG